MTFLETATKILKDNNNQPMSSRDILDSIEKQSLVHTKGKTPWASLNSIMLYSSSTDLKNYSRRLIQNILKSSYVENAILHHEDIFFM